MRGISSAGRAPALHAGGQEFESPILHQLKNKTFFWRSYFFLGIIVIYWVLWLLQMVWLFRAVHFEILFRKSAEKLGKNFFKIPVTWKFLIDSKKTQRSELVFQFFWLWCNVSVPWRILTRLSKTNAVPVKKNLTEWSFYERKNVMECKDFRQ